MLSEQHKLDPNAGVHNLMKIRTYCCLTYIRWLFHYTIGVLSFVLGQTSGWQVKDEILLLNLRMSYVISTNYAKMDGTVLSREIC